MNLSREDRERLTALVASLEVAKRLRQRSEPSWKTYLNAYTDRVVPDVAKEGDEYRHNIILPNCRVAIASMTVTEPKILVRPRQASHAPRAVLVEYVLEAWWDAYHVQDAMTRAVQDAVLIGQGWTRSSWVTELLPAPPGSEDEDVVEFMLQAVTAMAEDGVPAEDLPSEREIRTYVRQRMAVVAADQPLVQRVSPFDLWYDPEADEPVTEARWICERSYRDYLEVVDDDRLSPSERREVRPTVQLSDPQKRDWSRYGLRTNDVTPSSPGLDRVELWTMYDCVRREVWIWASGRAPEKGEVLFRDRVIFRRGHPYNRVTCFDAPETSNPVGFVEVLAPLQDEINDIRRTQAKVRRRFLTKFFARSNYMNDSVREAIESDEPGAIGLIDDEDIPFDQVLYAVNPPPVSPDLYAMSNQILADVDRTVAVSAYEKGASPGSATATEVNAVLGFSSARARELERKVHRAMEQTARDLITLAQYHLNDTAWVRLQQDFDLRLPPPPSGVPVETDAKGNLYYPFNGTDLAGEYEFKVAAGSTAPDTEVQRKQEAIQLMQLMLPLAQAGAVNLAELARWVLRYGFNIVDTDKFVAMPEMYSPPGAPGNVGTPGQSGGLAPGGGLPPQLEALMAESGRRGGQPAQGQPPSAGRAPS